MEPPTVNEKAWEFDGDFTLDTYVFLVNSWRFNLDSRRLMANAIRNAVYTPLEGRQGEFREIDDTRRRLLLNLATLEILSKVYMALEDLGRLLVAFQGPLPELPRKFASLEQKRALGSFAKLCGSPDRDLHAVMGLLKPERYKVTSSEARALTEYNTHHVTTVRRLLSFLATFVTRHNLAYNRYKHGMPIIMDLQAEEPLPKGFDGLVSIVKDAQDLRRSGLFLVGEEVVQKLILLVTTVIDFSKILVGRRLQMAELGGLPLPALCERQLHDGQVQYQLWWFPGISEQYVAEVAEVTRRVLAVRKHTRIAVNIEMKLEHTLLNDWVGFYQRDWRIT